MVIGLEPTGVSTAAARWVVDHFAAGAEPILEKRLGAKAHKMIEMAKITLPASKTKSLPFSYKLMKMFFQRGALKSTWMHMSIEKRHL